MSGYLGKIVYLSEEDYSTLIANGSITKNNITINYNENDLYVTSDTNPNIKFGTTSYWNSRSIFTPSEGEIIIYTDKDINSENESFINIPGIKIGNGLDSVIDLPFITDRIEKFILEETYNDFPSIGNTNKLYIALDTLTIYQWRQGNYIELYKFQKQQITTISSWNAGTMTELEVNNGKLLVTNGTVPVLNTSNINVITNFS